MAVFEARIGRFEVSTSLFEASLAFFEASDSAPGIRSARSKLRNPHSKLQAPYSKLRSPRSRFRNRHSRFRNAQVALADVLVEERDGPLPGQFGRRLVVARCRVVVEAVLGTGVEIALVGDVRRLERGFELRPARVDARIYLGRLYDQGTPDLRHVCRVRGRAVEGHAGGQGAPQAGGQGVHHP